MAQTRPNLPEEPDSFVGRERELGELRRLMGLTRVLTLSGVGGIGKTRLALRLLTALARDWPDGVWFVELGDLRQPDLVVSRVASVVGISEEPGRPLLETLAEALAERRILVALDNCEHLIDACARVCTRLLAGSPGLRVIATSREPLRVAGETVWQVPTLSVAPIGVSADVAGTDGAEAVRLFADRAAAACPGFAVGRANVAAVAALCRALDGMPLAIELAAARVRVLSLEQIAARLSDRFALLTTGDRTAPPRQRTLRATIDWSHDLLTAREQVLLRRLSVFAGWSLEMAEQVCCDEDLLAPDILDLLTALVDKSLVVREPEALGQARYRLLDTIREYAARRLADAGEAAAFQLRLREYALRVVEHSVAVGMAQIPATWLDRVDVFRRYDVDAANVWQALSWCLADGDAESGMRICAGVRPCWLVRGAYAEGGEWLDSFLELDAPAVPARVRGAALVGRGQLALSSDPVRAEAWAREGLELCRDDGDTFWTAAALNLCSEIALHTGRADEAARYADEALAAAVSAGDGWNEGYALGTRAAIAGLAGRFREAQQLAKASLSVMRRIDQRWGAARALMGLGDLARLRGDPGDARRRYLEALVILRDIDAKPEIARCEAGLGRVALEAGAIGRARRHLTASLRLSHATGARISVARGLEAFAALVVREGRLELAVRLTAAAAALREAAGLPALSGARVEQHLAPARRLGEPAVARLWSQGRALSSDAAVALAVDAPTLAAAPGPGLDAVAAEAGAGDYDVTTAQPSALTPREREVIALVASGRSNKAIAAELVISPATVARHVANILAKLGFSSRAQVAAWAVDQRLDLAGRVRGTAPARRAQFG